MRVHFILHESFEGPGAFASWAQARQHAVSSTRTYCQDPLTTASEVDLLVVMGGPQSPDTKTSDCPHFDAAAEIALIRDMLAAHKAVVGVCLGAQLLGVACGAPHTRSPRGEFGLFDVQLSEAGRADPCLRGFPASFMAGHWHNDMPGLSEGSVILASSPQCPRQIVRYGARAYGFQCHLEVDGPSLGGMFDACPDDVLETTLRSPVVSPRADVVSHDYALMHALVWAFLDTLVALPHARTASTAARS